MRTAFISTLLVALVLGLSSCTAPRYTTYSPNGNTGPQWRVKAEKDIGDYVTLTINGKKVLGGQGSIFGEKEYKGKYQGHDVSMVLRQWQSTEHQGIEYECLVYADGKQIGDFRW